MLLYKESDEAVLFLSL